MKPSISVNFIRLFAFTLLIFQTSEFLLAQTQESQQIEHYDAVIVGGGISGLATLNDLIEKGIKKVLVLESANRVGGKIWTQRSNSDNKAYYERGAELVNSNDFELINLINSLGLELVERRFKRDLRSEVPMFRERLFDPYGKIVLGKTRNFTFDELVEKMNEFPQDRQIFEKIIKYQKLRTTDNLTTKRNIQREIRSITASTIAADGVYSTAFLESLIKSEFGVSLSEINAEVLLDYVSISEEPISTGPRKYKIEIIPNADEKYRVKGGTDSLITALEEKHKQRIRKNTEVNEIKQIDSNEFEIRTNDYSKIIKAKHVVIAVPSYDLPKLNIISSEVTPAKIHEAAALPFGHNAKIFLIFKEKFWNRAYDNNNRNFGGVGILESGVQFWDTTENQKQTKEGVITLYPGNWPTNEIEQKEMLEKIIDELRLVPGLENLDNYLKNIDIHNWQRSYAGVFNAHTPKAPRLFAENLSSNIYFVGSDKDNNTRGEISESYGYMNGAVRTALKAGLKIYRKIRADDERHPEPKALIRKLSPIKMSCNSLLLGA